MKSWHAYILLYGFMIAVVGFILWFGVWMQIYSPLAKGLKVLGL